MNLRTFLSAQFNFMAKLYYQQLKIYFSIIVFISIVSFFFFRFDEIRCGVIFGFS